MKMIDFKDYENDFTWDYVLHFPIPTLDYIKRRTGEDLTKHFDTSDEAIGVVLAMTRSAKNYLFAYRTDMLAWEYQMAHKIDLLYDVLEYILEVINFAFISGEYAELYKVLDGKAKSIALENAKYNLLGATKIMLNKELIRKGY